MRASVRFPSRPAGASPDASHGAPSAAGDHPTPGEVLSEIGVLLVVHLAAAIAITLTLRLFGIA